MLDEGWIILGEIYCEISMWFKAKQSYISNMDVYLKGKQLITTEELAGLQREGKVCPLLLRQNLGGP